MSGELVLVISIFRTLIAIISLVASLYAYPQNWIFLSELCVFLSEEFIFYNSFIFVSDVVVLCYEVEMHVHQCVLWSLQFC